MGAATVLALVAGCTAHPIPKDWTITEAAEAATAREDWPAALEFWNRAMLETRGNEPRPYLEKARALWMLDDEEAAQILLNRGIDRYPDEHQMRLLRGRLLCERGYERAAEHDFLSAVEIDPDCAESWLLLARVQLELDRPANAETGFDRHIELSGGDSDAWFLLGRACSENGKLDKAVECFRGAFESGAVSVSQLVLAASVVTLEDLGPPDPEHVEQALTWIDAALGRQPQHAEGWYVRGMLFELRDDDMLAAVSYSRAVELDGFHLLAMTRLACTYARIGEIERANAMIDRALGLNIAASRRRMLERVRASWTVPAGG